MSALRALWSIHAAEGMTASDPRRKFTPLVSTGWTGRRRTGDLRITRNETGHSP